MHDHSDRSRVTTRTIYRCVLQLADGILSRESVGTDCAAADLARRLRPRVELGESEALVLVQVDQRLGSDGAWHITSETILEVL